MSIAAAVARDRLRKIASACAAAGAVAVLASCASSSAATADPFAPCDVEQPVPAEEASELAGSCDLTDLEIVLEGGQTFIVPERGMAVGTSIDNSTESGEPSVEISVAHTLSGELEIQVDGEDVLAQS